MTALLSFEYATLPADLRLLALGLPISEPCKRCAARKAAERAEEAKAFERAFRHQQCKEILSDREACERALGFKIDAQNIAEAVEFLTAVALENGEEDVKLPIKVAAAAVLRLKGVVKPPSHRPRDTYWQQRKKMREKYFPRSNPEYQMILWARERKQALLADAKARNSPTTADHAGELAAKEAKQEFPRFASLGWQTIKRRMSHPSRYTAGRTRPGNPLT
jgi:hypothetical protein